MQPPIPTPSSYEEIADSFSMTPPIKARFITFMERRFPSKEKVHCLNGYATEWALRFLHVEEYLYADEISTDILKTIDGAPSNAEHP
jgi:hypothetical protein